MALILLILTVVSLQAKVAVAQFFNQYNPGYSNLYGTNQYQYPYNTAAGTLPFQNSYYPNNNLYQNTNLYPNTNLYGAGTTSYNGQLSQPYAYNPNNPSNIYNTNNQLYNPYSVSAVGSVPGTIPGLLPTQGIGACQYRLFQGCMAPTSSGCRQCIDTGNAIVHNCVCASAIGAGVVGK